MKIALYILLAYVLYRFITGFVIPVYKTTKQVKKGFQQMQQHMNEQMQKQQTQAQPQQNSEPKKPIGDYIEFEEVK